MGIMDLGPGIPTAAHRRLLAAIAKNDYLMGTFYFTGGTALAEYYLRHRYSEDLDFFTGTAFDSVRLETEAGKIFRSLKPDRVELAALNQQHTYFVSLGKERIKVDFAYYPFEHLGDFKKHGRLKISSLLDITVNKVHAITTRKRGRDFLDLYLASAREKWDYRFLLAQYRLKFDVVMTSQELAKHYAGVMEALDQPRYLGTVSWKEVETYFLNQAKKMSLIG